MCCVRSGWDWEVLTVLTIRKTLWQPHTCLGGYTSARALPLEGTFGSSWGSR